VLRDIRANKFANNPWGPFRTLLVEYIGRDEAAAYSHLRPQGYRAGRRGGMLRLSVDVSAISAADIGPSVDAREMFR
jgi:hypothetical protein